MKSNVKKYTDVQIWDRVLQIGGQYPKKGRLAMVAIQSNEQAFNVFDDKIYVFIGTGKTTLPRFIKVSTCTTGSGKNGLFNFQKYNKNGVFVWKTNEWYEGNFEGGFHKGKMKAWILKKPVKYYRDNDRDTKAEEIGMVYYGNKHTNIHAVSYNPLSNFIKKYINGWSLGCIVWNRTKDYYDIIRYYWRVGRKLDFAILKEW